jgi:putative FmdB family regulatory protein
MPTYDYKCVNCGKKFSLVMTIRQHDSKKPKCPKCNSRKVKQQLASFFAITSDKS